ncbi:hypothetical protein [Larkinella soli]|uniref:hypothetical protein n=1 Tax=Larkinella soli TaxID=1770527 RepID=UPI000FFBEDEC|nr:hypothetical protein [Larkinella soli]
MKDETDNEKESYVRPEESRITGKSEGPYRSDGTDEDVSAFDNRHREEVEDSASGWDSVQIRGAQDGRNDRFMGSQDMDDANGILRFNDQDYGDTRDVTDEGMNAAAAGDAQTNTSTVDVTTAGPDDYASGEDVPTPEAQRKAKEQDNAETPGADDPENGREQSNSADSQEQRDHDMAHTGTDTEHKPVY